MKITIIWDVMPRNRIDGYQRFKCMYCFHRQGQTKQASTQQDSIRYVVTASFLLADCMVYLSELKMEAVRRSETSVNC
jgi:hypothetical protein